jgi:hypothetical protein
MMSEADVKPIMLSVEIVSLTARPAGECDCAFCASGAVMWGVIASIGDDEIRVGPLDSKEQAIEEAERMTKAIEHALQKHAQVWVKLPPNTRAAVSGGAA